MAYKDIPAEKKLIKSRIQLLVEFPFFGQLALFLKLVKRDGVRTAATDGKCYFYNEQFVNNLPEKQVNFLTAHETLHPALGHLWRCGSRDKVIWNHAADYVINSMIIECDPQEQHFQMIPGGLYDKKFDGKSSEEIYDILINDEDYVKKARMQAQGQGGGAPGGVGQPGGTLDDHSVWEEKDGPGADGEEKEGGAGDLSAGNEEDWQGRLVAAAQVAEGRDRGKIPALIGRLIGQLTNPQKNWKELLADFISQEINDYGFNPPDRRFSWNDLILPDFSEPEDVIKWLVFAVDTSGSIGEKEFIVFISEVVGCLSQFGGKVKGKLIYCDAHIHPDGVYDLEDAAHSLPRGGGGTAFEPVFDWIEENMEECCGLVYLTDGMGSYPATQPDYPVLWALIHDYKVPWGLTTEIKVA
ncbi:hypothetical protein D3C71_923570 [compost metagenome]